MSPWPSNCSARDNPSTSTGSGDDSSTRSETDPSRAVAGPLNPRLPIREIVGEPMKIHGVPKKAKEFEVSVHDDTRAQVVVEIRIYSTKDGSFLGLR